MLASPGDPVFDSAHHAVTLANVGWIVGGIGAAAFVGGLVWYVKTGHMETEESPAGVTVTPWFGPSSGGLAISGSLR